MYGDGFGYIDEYLEINDDDDEKPAIDLTIVIMVCVNDYWDYRRNNYSPKFSYNNMRLVPGDSKL